MTLTLRPVPRRYEFALDEIKRNTTRRLRMEIEEEVLSQEITDRHNTKLLRSQHFRQHGEI